MLFIYPSFIAVYLPAKLLHFVYFIHPFSFFWFFWFFSFYNNIGKINIKNELKQQLFYFCNLCNSECSIILLFDQSYLCNDLNKQLGDFHCILM